MYKKQMALSVFALLLSLFSHSQSTVVRDTMSNFQEETSFTFNVKAELASLEKVVINHYGVYDLDTIPLFVGTYSLVEKSPSDFLTFLMNETLGELSFGIGSFTADSFYSKIELVRLVGLTEEFIFN